MPLPLTFAESHDLAERIKTAVDTAQDDFLRTTVVRDANGVAVGGPDPRAVHADATLALARLLHARGLDLVDVSAFENKLARLEAELTGRS